MRKRIVFLGSICILLLISSITFADEVELPNGDGWGARDVVDALIEAYGAIPDNEYYLSIEYNSRDDNETFSSCAEALNRKDELLRRSDVISITIRSLYRTHFHSDCNEIYYR